MVSRRHVILPLLALVLAARGLCNDHQQHSGAVTTESCTKDVQLRAERASENIRSWSAIHTYFVTYSNCPFDADAAEGISDSIGWLLLNRWDAIPHNILAADARFRAYILGGVNSTLDRKTLEQIVIRTKRSPCAGIAAPFCNELRKRAAQALHEQP